MNNITKSLYISGLIILSACLVFTGVRLNKTISENVALEQRLSKAQDKVVLLEAEVIKLNDTIALQGEEISNLTGQLYDSEGGHDFSSLASFYYDLLIETGYSENEIYDIYEEFGKTGNITAIDFD